MADVPQYSKPQLSGSGGVSESSDQGDDGLPMREGWSSLPLHCLQGCWLPAQAVTSVRLVQAQFKPRPDDIFLITFPKCGTTWLKALAFTLLNRSRHPVAAGGDDHPLLSHNPHDLVPFLELPHRQLYPVTELEALPSPRLLSTHLPPALLPQPLPSLGSGTSPPAPLGFRAVYLCREPKDVLVSLWHHHGNVHHDFFTELDKAFELFSEGVSFYGPVWEHYLGYRKLSVENPSRVLFLKYDEMMAEPSKHVRMLAEFLGVPFTEEEESSGVVEDVVRLCSFESLKNLQVNTHGVANRIGALRTKNSLFFRSGKVGEPFDPGDGTQAGSDN